MHPLSTTFCARDALDVAQDLLGCVVEHNGCSGMIVETEAYKRDPASHVYTLTPRSEIMLRTHGRWYIYFIYGMYHCLNVTTNKGDVGAVLIRALEPLTGIDAMKQHRNTDSLHNLTNGPGKLCTALGLTRAHNDTPLTGPVRLLHHEKIPRERITATTRIGITKGAELPWRFYIQDNPYVSRK